MDTGRNGSVVINFLRMAVDTFLDNDSDKWGKEAYGHLVSEAAKIYLSKIEVVIVTMASDLKAEMIKRQLLEYEVDEEKIVYFKDYPLQFKNNKKQYFGSEIIKLLQKDKEEIPQYDILLYPKGL